MSPVSGCTRTMSGGSTTCCARFGTRATRCSWSSTTATSSPSTPATYIGLMDLIRQLFAKANGVDAGLFSFNSKGACEECQGRGVIITELAYMDPITTHCESCDGRRFKEAVLAYRLRGKSIADVLEMEAWEATGFFSEGGLHTRIGA